MHTAETTFSAMPDRGGFSPIGRMLVITAAAVAILAGMRAAGPILGPIFVALVIHRFPRLLRHSERTRKKG